MSVGAPVPLVPTNDAVTCRDVARALQMVVAQLVGQPFRTRIGVGTSSGARLFASLNFGRSVVGSSSVRTGGHHVVPYDTGSPRIFDGYILNGFPYIQNVDHVDTIQPLSAPTILIQGQGDAEVARRWFMLCPQRKNADGSAKEPTQAENNSIATDPDKLRKIRRRLSDISWWMHLLCKHVGQRANRETGDFGRF